MLRHYTVLVTDWDFSVPTQGAWSQIKGRIEPLESTAGVRPMDRDELVRYSRQIGERREAWREACEAHLADLVRAYPRR